jgi:hypothetical protein
VIYRTAAAISRSKNPEPPLQGASDLTNTARSYIIAGYDPSTYTKPLPRGHLAYYKRFVSPTATPAFKARLDCEGVKMKEKVALGAVRTDTVYIWDVDDGTVMETMAIDLGDRAEVQVRSSARQILF